MPVTRLQATPQSIHLCGEAIPRAGHICAFFDSRREKYSVLAPYFADGIKDGDRVINVIDAADRDAHVRALTLANVPVRDAIDRGQFQLLTAEETYLRDGAVDLEGMLDLVKGALEAAKHDGCCVRTCGEMNWVGRSRISSAQVMSYEARVNSFVPTFQCTLVCVYDVAQTPPGMVADILATHPAAIINGKLRTNPFFVEPSAFLEMLRRREEMARRAG